VQPASWLSYLAFSCKPFHFQPTSLYGGVILMSERMKRLKLYLETSVWNFLFADDAPTKRAITEQFFQQIEVEHCYDLFISTFVMEELERTGNPTRRQALLEAVAQRTPELLDERPEIEALADQFVAGGVVPAKYHGDAIHLAYAYVHDMDALVSWNQH